MIIMANNLVSPGVQITVIDESNYAPTSTGTVPFILLATAQDKTNAAGSLASYTTQANAGKLFNISSQRELVNYYGLPTFPTDASGNRIYGSELAEYGLHSAHNTLDIISSAYIMRADVDLAQLESTTVRPTASAPGGTLWLNSASTSWGVFSWNETSETFVRRQPSFISDSALLNNSDVPLGSYGNIGDFAIVGTLSENPLYEKNFNNIWVLVGSNDWHDTCAPSVTATNSNVTTLTAGHSFKINQTTLTLGAGTDTALVTQINSANITGVKAAKVNGKLCLFVRPTAESDGSTVDGAVELINVSGTALTTLGITAGVYYGSVAQFSKHTVVPAWKAANPEPRPTGSIWIKTSNFNFGANLGTYRRNAVTDNWDLIPSIVEVGRGSAQYALDPTRGGLGIADGTLFTYVDVYRNGTVTYQVLEHSGSGLFTVAGSVANPVLTTGHEFEIYVSPIGSALRLGPYLVTVPASPNNTVAGVAAAISALNIVQGSNTLITASVTSNGNLALTHSFAGLIWLEDVTGTALTSMGFTTAVEFISDNDASGGVILTRWVAPTIIQQPTEPTAIPADGTLWMFKGQEVDILINNGTDWKGYQNVISDYRGFNLSLTDPNGPIISPTQPTLNSLGNALTYGDLWIDTSDFDNYPVIYRWESIGGTNAWNLIDNTDDTTTEGILFADARWDTDGTKNIFTDDIVAITDLLISDYVDLDAPDPTLYPVGCLLFNTRRSSNNVKRYVEDYFNATDFPLLSLPTITDTWQSASGKKWNNVPYFGRQAQRNVVVSALASTLALSQEIKEEGKDFNLLCCPGYPELLDNLKSLNDARKNTGFIIGEVPMGLSTNTTDIENYLTDVLGTGITGEDSLNTSDPYTAIFYPGTAIMDSLDGLGSIAVPASTPMLKTFIRNDQVGELWFAPAGNKRGVVSSVKSIGFIDRNDNNSFTPTGVPQELRDLLYQNQVNPITFLPGVGRVNYGNKTRQPDATALDRINVARLVCYLRRQIESIIRPLIFEPNDKLTRDTAKSLVDKLLNDVVVRRGLYDYLVVCDRTNNTNDTIDRNELHIDIAIEPIKAVEFIYIPVRIKGTGDIAAGNFAASTPLA